MNERSLTSDAGTFKAPSELTPTQRAARRRIEEHWDEEIDDSSDLQWPLVLWQNFVRPLVAYAGSVGAIATRQAKPYLALALLLYLTLGVGRNLMLYTMDQALSPLCRIPGASFLNLPFCPSAKQLNLSGPAEFDKLMDAQSAFNEVLVTTAGGYSLPMEMKRSESSIRDLKHVVEYSNLPSRNELVFEFSGFVETARQASQDLSKFNSRIGRAVDHILSTNHWTLQTIADVAERDAQKGAVSRWASKNLDILAPFKPVRLNRDVLLDQYLRHTSIVEEEILRLINEAQALLHLLDNLDNRLDIIASIATRDGIRVEDNREELFAMLWTKLGGNRSTAAKLEKQMKLLKDVQSYKRLAWAHVSGTIVKLQAISDNLEDLRERVGMPEVVGADRIPLEVHIQNIALGIERLETQRQSSRQIEAESYQRVLDKAESGDRLIEAREL
ncbi:hypothetical protein K431DRAFT_226422 [Polychaeton citri CBS 116435]|uniref:Uncharacterized protein n=1 Tax=Polychaeton citri CBS 116435 TaxID=1314669 RepID=A0A9P4Q920_9PEZI|nr:hypothetical protein K431DRAFT_226422 [Polychaeton citri CBS 116435]